MKTDVTKDTGITEYTAIENNLVQENDSGDDWLVDIFPRRRELAGLGRTILDVLDERGFLLVRGWHKEVGWEHLSRSSYRTTMSKLVKKGVVEVREAYAPKGRFVKVYVRSERILETLGEVHNEMVRYRRLHTWWLPRGPVRTPSRKRKAKPLVKIRHDPPTCIAMGPEGISRETEISQSPNPPSPVPKEDFGEFNSSKKHKSHTPPHVGHEPEKKPTESDDDLYKRLAKTLGTSPRRAKESAEQWAEELSLNSPRDVALLYLKG